MTPRNALPLVILFAKAPLPGRVKTRLLSALTPQQAADLHTALVYDMLAMLRRLRLPADVELHTDVPTAAWSAAGVRRKLQSEGGLGEKMLAAIDAGLAAGHPAVLVLGSDSPGLPLAHVENLLSLETDLKLGPAEDGGYYGICARRTAAGMFDGVRWSTAHTLADTVAAAGRCGLSVSFGESWFDLDEPAALPRTARVVPPGSAAARWFRDPDVQSRLAK